MPGELAGAYKSPSQQVRVVSEAWAERNQYCPACPSDSLARFPHNEKSLDFTCKSCGSHIQLKSSRHSFGRRINDGDFKAMTETIVAGRTPSLLLLHYEHPAWEVRGLTLIPSFAFAVSCLEKRPPLSPAARRHDWVGCNILLENIPADARIPVVVAGVEQEPSRVRRQFDRLRPIARLDSESRGWTLDVLRVLRALGKEQFALSDVYAHADELGRLHPGNRHVDEKIRQQLQVLRDLGFLEFLNNRGQYRLHQ